MSYFLDNWGSVVGIVGVIVGLIGVGFSVAAFYRAGKARDAAEAARRETRTAMTRALTAVDLERAIALVQRLNEFHRAGRWEVSLALYPTLRVMLSDIRSRHPSPTTELQQQLRENILQINEMEHNVDAAFREDSAPSELQTFNDVMTNIEVILLDMSDTIQSFHESNG